MKQTIGNKVAQLGLLVLVLVALTACGKKGPLTQLSVDQAQSMTVTAYVSGQPAAPVVSN